MVPVAEAVVLLVLVAPETLSVKVSSGSTVVSPRRVTGMVAVVAPAAMVREPLVAT